MKLIAVLNRDVPLGQVINGLAHMTLGLGHRILGLPDINIFWGDAKQVRAFRNTASQLSRQNQTALYTDFPHTMSGVTAGVSAGPVALTAQTLEKDITYFAAILISQEINQEIAEIINSCQQLAGYIPYKAENKASLLAPKRMIDNRLPDKKISMMINTKVPFAKSFNAIILASLEVGKSADYSQLSLLNLLDKDNNLHPYISYHPYAIVKAKEVPLHVSMAKSASQTKTLTVETVGESQPFVTVVFGDRTELEKVILRNQTRLFDNKLESKELIPAVQKLTILPSTTTNDAEKFVEGTTPKKNKEDSGVTAFFAAGKAPAAAKAVDTPELEPEKKSTDLGIS